MAIITIYKKLVGGNIGTNPMTFYVTDAQAALFNARLPKMVCQPMCPLCVFFGDPYTHHVHLVQNLIAEIEQETRVETRLEIL